MNARGRMWTMQKFFLKKLLVVIENFCTFAASKVQVRFVRMLIKRESGVNPEQFPLL